MAMQQSFTRDGIPPPFSSALLLTDQEPNAAADRIALRGAGIQRVRIGLSGTETVRFLAAKVSKVLVLETELIICLPCLDDMTAGQFAALVRSHPLLTHIPLMAITPEHGQEALLRQSGFNGVLIRPFTTTALLNQMHTTALEAKAARGILVASLRGATALPPHDEFDVLLRQLSPPDRESMSGDAAFRQGVGLMRDHQWERALPFLQKATIEGNHQGDAHVALAAFWQAGGEPAKMEIHLSEAFHIYMEAQAWEKLHKLTRRLAKDCPALPSPLLKELERRAWQNQPAVLAELAKLAQGLLPDDDVKSAVLKGYEASGASLSGVAEELKKAGCSGLAQSLTEELEPEPEASKRGGWFRRRQAAPEAKPQNRKGIALAPESEKTDAHSDKAAISPAETPGLDTLPMPGTKQGQVIALLGDVASGEQDSPGSSLGSSFLGDAGAMIKGTLRLYKRKK